jgi:hypothetical protein
MTDRAYCGLCFATARQDEMFRLVICPLGEEQFDGQSAQICGMTFRPGKSDMQACATVAALQVSSALAAIVAAVFWLWSALTPVPKRLRAGPAPNLFDIFDEIHVSLARQSRRSAIAAGAAAVSAAMQVVLIFAPACLTMTWPF